MFWIKKTIAALVLPPFGPLLLILLGLLLIGRWPRIGKGLAWTGLIGALFFSTPLTVSRILAPLERVPPLSAEAIRGAGAIVILAGGKRSNAPEYGGQTVSRLSLERVRYGARLAKTTGLPILVSGGIVLSGPPEAELMKTALEQDFGAKVRWVEASSRDTGENAQFSAAILQKAGIHRVLLVSHAVHMARAQTEFAHAGIETIAAPTGFFGKPTDSAIELQDLIPNASAAYAGWISSHEWLGNLVLRAVQ